MAKKIKIDIDFSEDINFLGISFHKKDYFLAFRLNELCNLKLKREKDLPYFNQKINGLLNYPLFYYYQHDNHLAYYLIANFNEESKLFTELRTMDYFLLLHGKVTDELISKQLSKIRQINGVLTALKVDVTKLKDFNNFLSDLEIHITSIIK